VQRNHILLLGIYIYRERERERERERDEVSAKEPHIIAWQIYNN
jgi:hypothetical protein